MAVEIVARSKELDIVYCYLGYHYQFPIIISKLLGKKVICGAWGVAKEAETNYGKIIGRILQFFLEFMYFFSDVIIIQSWRITEHKYLTKWKKKMRLGAQYFGEGEIFRPIVPFSKRSDTIGFVGRFTRTKGILELLEAIPLVLRKNNRIKFVLIGKGLFDKEIRQTINDLDLAGNVDIVGQVRNEDLPNYYNQFKLLVIPSTSEGLPNVMLEAISCHTPVLATPVGAIPDILREGETGFLLENNSPEEIARRVIELFNHQDQLEQVTTKAQLVLHENYSFSAAAQRIQTLIDELSVG
jgi:glycosyltransferase involved in cell wall biosynthesis